MDMSDNGSYSTYSTTLLTWSTRMSSESIVTLEMNEMIHLLYTVVVTFVLNHPSNPKHAGNCIATPWKPATAKKN